MDLENITQTSIDLKVLNAIALEVEETSQMPAIGLLTGADFDFDYLPHAKTYLMSSSTLREAVHAVDYARQLISPILVLKLKETETDAILTFQPNVEFSCEDERQNVEMVFSTVRTIFSKLLKKDFPIKSVNFRHQEHHLLNIYEDFFHCSIILGAPVNAMLFKRSILDVPLPGGFPEIHQQAKQVIEQQISESPLQKGLVSRITQIMQKSKIMFTENIDHIAGSLHMSSRTLQRRLDQEGVSFMELKDQIRFKLAISAIKLGKLSIEQISEDLGFSDRHSFTRAFKRWSGVSPSAFRKKHPK